MSALAATPGRARARRAIAVATTLAAAFWVASGFVDLLAPLVPAHVEARIGDALWQELAPRLAPGRQAESAAIEALARRIAPHLGVAAPFHAAVLSDPGINAYAVAGGGLLLSQGLVDGVRSSNELAFVIGHLLGHLAERDQLKTLGRGLAVAIVADLVGFGQAACARQLVRGGLLTNMKFRGRVEAAADHAGLLGLAREFGSVHGAHEFFDQLDAAGWPVSHFIETPTSAQTRRRGLSQVIVDEGWSTVGRVVPIPWRKPRS